jgi:hypothetical protein
MMNSTHSSYGQGASTEGNPLSRTTQQYTSMQAKYPRIVDLWDEWKGNGDRYPDGGVERLEGHHRARWRRHFDRAQKTHISRVKAIVRELLAKKEEVGTIEAALEWMERIYKDECRKALSNLETWLKDNGLVGKRANRGRRSNNKNGAATN